VSPRPSEGVLAHRGAGPLQAPGPVAFNASTEELTEAKKYLLEEHAGHERSREAIEDAFDKIIAEKFRERKKTKINLKVQ